MVSGSEEEAMNIFQPPAVLAQERGLGQYVLQPQTPPDTLAMTWSFSSSSFFEAAGTISWKYFKKKSLCVCVYILFFFFKRTTAGKDPTISDRKMNQTPL